MVENHYYNGSFRFPPVSVSSLKQGRYNDILESIVDVPGDGHCGYHALLYLLFKRGVLLRDSPTRTHLVLRKMVQDFANLHFERFVAVHANVDQRRRLIDEIYEEEMETVPFVPFDNYLSTDILPVIATMIQTPIAMMGTQETMYFPCFEVRVDAFSACSATNTEPLILYLHGIHWMAAFGRPACPLPQVFEQMEMVHAFQSRIDEWCAKGL